MPSSLHNVIVELLGEHPDALEYLLFLHGTPPPDRLIPTTGTRTRTLTIERRVDRAFLVGSRKAPASFVLAEVQLDADDAKRYSWPLYMELSRSSHRCEGGLVVLTFSDRVRRWIETFIVPPSGAHGTSRQLRPTVLAVDLIEPQLLLRMDMPHLAQLAVAAHPGGPAAQGIAERAVDITLERLPIHLAAEQLDAILPMVDATLHARLQERVMEHREYRSEFFRGIYQQGAAEGKAEGKAEAVLTVLAARGIPVSDAIRAQIAACTSSETLDRWLRRAAVASTAAAVVRPPPAKRPATKRRSRGPQH